MLLMTERLRNHVWGEISSPFIGRSQGFSSRKEYAEAFSKLGEVTGNPLNAYVCKAKWAEDDEPLTAENMVLVNVKYSEDFDEVTVGAIRMNEIHDCMEEHYE